MELKAVNGRPGDNPARSARGRGSVVVVGPDVRDVVVVVVVVVVSGEVTAGTVNVVAEVRSLPEQPAATAADVATNVSASTRAAAARRNDTR
ncbi:MAG: hypothetical protein QOH10_1018 [Actinomycetota bacterium]|nr:hypothetical protein [Actinomycetota bacterium]